MYSIKINKHKKASNPIGFKLKILIYLKYKIFNF